MNCYKNFIIGLCAWSAIQCGDANNPNNPSSPIVGGDCQNANVEAGLVLSLTTSLDYQSSQLEAFAAACPADVRTNIVLASGDAEVRHVGSHVVVMNRGAESNLLILDHAFQVERQVSLPGCGPHDVVLVGDQLWVTCYEDNALREVSIVNGNVTTGASLAALQDFDLLPEMDQMFVTGDAVWVSIQNLDRNGGYAPTGVGSLAKVDRASRTLQTAVSLPCENPFTRLVKRGADTWVGGCSGNFGTSSGFGIFEFSTATESALPLATDTELPGPPLDVTVHDGEVMTLVSVAPPNDPFNTDYTAVIGLGPGLSSGQTERFREDGFSLSSLVSTSHGMFVANRSADGQRQGMWNIQSDGITGPFQGGLAPKQLEVVE